AKAQREKRPLSIGLLGNAAEIIPELARRQIKVDLLTDQTSAHDPLVGYIPKGLNVQEAAAMRRADPQEYLRRSMASIGDHVRGMLALQRQGSHAFDYGNNIR